MTYIYLKEDKSEVGVIGAADVIPRGSRLFPSDESGVLPYEAPQLTASQKRDLSLASMVHDFGDGRVIQVRPIDAANIHEEISRMSRNADEPQRWRMADNVWHDVTVAELQAALEAGQDQARVIWDQYEIDTTV